jgi:hypothetical protein
MNQISMILPPAGPIEQRAQRIRDLVGTARTCIIEIGRELIAAKGELAHGDWLPWLEAEFGWGETTARKYMQVAEMFAKSSLGADFEALTIDATALYALASPDVPPAAREEAIGRASRGERITKAEAGRIVDGAVREAEAKFRQAMAEFRAEAAMKTQRAIDEATIRFAKDRAALEAEIAKIKATGAEPNVTQAIGLFCQILGRKTLNEKQMRLIAQILEGPITDGRRTYHPVSEEAAQHVEINLRVSSAAIRAIEYFATAPPPAEVIAAFQPVQRAGAQRQIERARKWVVEFSKLLKGE